MHSARSTRQDEPILEFHPTLIDDNFRKVVDEVVIVLMRIIAENFINALKVNGCIKIARVI